MRRIDRLSRARARSRHPARRSWPLSLRGKEETRRAGIAGRRWWPPRPRSDQRVSHSSGNECVARLMVARWRLEHRSPGPPMEDPLEQAPVRHWYEALATALGLAFAGQVAADAHGAI